MSRGELRHSSTLLFKRTTQTYVLQVHTCFTMMSSGVPGMKQLPRLASNVCRNYQNVNNQLVMILPA
jgi:hypothetical protein